MYSELYIDHRHDHQHTDFDAILMAFDRLGDRPEPSCQTLTALAEQIERERKMAGIAVNEGVIVLDEEKFDEITVYSDKPVLVNFWAPWCGSCRRINPVLEEIASERSDIFIAKLNIDDNHKLAEKYRVRTIPTSIVFKTGEASDRMQGARPKSQIEQFINRNL